MALAALIVLFWGIHQYRNEVGQAAVVADALAAAPSLSVYRLHVEVDRGNLKLTGKVPSEHLRGQAEAIARAAAPTLELEKHHCRGSPARSEADSSRTALSHNHAQSDRWHYHYH